MAVDPAVRGLVTTCIAANNEARIAAGNERRLDSVASLRVALAALVAALQLDPDRTDPVWHNQPPHDLAAIAPKQHTFYLFVIALADAGRLS